MKTFERFYTFFIQLIHLGSGSKDLELDSRTQGWNVFRLWRSEIASEAENVLLSQLLGSFLQKRELATSDVYQIEAKAVADKKVFRNWSRWIRLDSTFVIFYFDVVSKFHRSFLPGNQVSLVATILKKMLQVSKMGHLSFHLYSYFADYHGSHLI